MRIALPDENDGFVTANFDFWGTMAEKPPDRREQGFYFALAQVGMEMVVPIGMGLALDHYLGWRPWGAIGGTLLGFVGGLFHLVALIQQHDRAQDKDSNSME